MGEHCSLVSSKTPSGRWPRRTDAPRPADLAPHSTTALMLQKKHLRYKPTTQLNTVSNSQAKQNTQLNVPSTSIEIEQLVALWC